MRPYLAILKDSFREALASKVLLVVLGLITLILLAVAPFSYREQKTTGLSRDAVQTWPRLIEQLRDDVKSPGTGPSHWIISRLEVGLQERIRTYQPPALGDPGAAFRMVGIIDELQKALRQQLTKGDFFDPTSWELVKKTETELIELLGREVAGLSSEDLERRNRLLMEAAYPELIPASPPTSLRIRYLSSDLFFPLPISKARFQLLIEEWVVWLLSWFVGVIGVGIALVISAPIVPQTFDPGSLHLLLSKPIQRWLLFLTKYAGGCAYTCISAGFFALGLWLILGTRFSIWNHQILISVPIFMFLFAINYSVSSLTGVIWRSPILCVVLSIMFWLTCSVLGIVKGRMDGWYIEKIRISRIVPAAEEMLIVNELGSTYRWEQEKQQWSEILVSENPEKIQLRLAMSLSTTIPRQLRPFGFAYDPRRAQYLVVEKNLMQQPALHIGRKESEWRDQEGIGLPFGSHDILVERDGGLLVFAQSGLFRIDGEPVAESSGPKLFGFKIPLLSRDPFKNVGPEPALSVGDRSVASISAVSGKLAVYSRGTLTILAPNHEGSYQRIAERKLNLEASLDAILALGDGRLALGLEDGRLQLYDVETLELRNEWRWENATPPRFIAASRSEDHFAVVLHNGSLWYLTGDETPLRPRLREQGEVVAATFAGPAGLLVAHRSNQVTEYSLPPATGTAVTPANWTVEREFAGPSTGLEKAYYYFVKPIHAVLPKPGELSDTLKYFVTGKSTVSDESAQGDLQSARKQLRPWNPVWSGALFVVLVLGIGCIYMQRSEF